MWHTFVKFFSLFFLSCSSPISSLSTYHPQFIDIIIQIQTDEHEKVHFLRMAYVTILNRCYIFLFSSSQWSKYTLILYDCGSLTSLFPPLCLNLQCHCMYNSENNFYLLLQTVNMRKHTHCAQFSSHMYNLSKSMINRVMYVRELWLKRKTSASSTATTN